MISRPSSAVIVSSRCLTGLHLILFFGFFIFLKANPDSIPAGFPEPASTTGDSSQGSAIVRLAPMIVREPKNSISPSRSENKWKFDQFLQGDHFHIRGGQIIDAIVFRQDYLKAHPQERAIVVAVREPKFGYVTQAVAAYTRGGKLRMTSSEAGDVSLAGLSASDINFPERIEQRLVEVRSSNLLLYDTAIEGLRDPVTRLSSSLILRSPGVALAHAEDTLDYQTDRHLSDLYMGPDAGELASAWHWLNDTERVGTIPVSRTKVKITLYSQNQSGSQSAGKDETLDAVIFDWNGVHYLYNPKIGTLSKPLPRNPVTGLPYLVVTDGDTLECLYFIATYRAEKPKEKAVFIPNRDGVHTAAAYTLEGKLWLLSPFLGRLRLPSNYSVDMVGALIKLHSALFTRETTKLVHSKNKRLSTAVPNFIIGDTGQEQVTRAYLAFKAAGIPVKLFNDKAGLPSLTVNYADVECTYAALSFDTGNDRN